MASSSDGLLRAVSRRERRLRIQAEPGETFRRYVSYTYVPSSTPSDSFRRGRFHSVIGWISVPREYLQERGQQSNFYRLVSAYRSHGHKQADIDPVSLGSVSSASAAKELQPNSYGLNLTDTVRFKGILFARRNEGTVGEAVSFLNSVYCGTVGTEFAHLEVSVRVVLIEAVASSSVHG